MKQFLLSIAKTIVKKIGNITWVNIFKMFHGGKEYLLTLNEWVVIQNILDKNYCFIVARRKTHLSSYAIAFAHFFKTGKWGYWSHCLMNCENVVHSIDDFKLVEATGVGVHYSPFEKVFDVDATALLIPVDFTLEEWTDIVEEMLNQLGRPYDTVFDFMDDKKVSCIETIYVALKKHPESIAFKELDALLKRYGALTPDMLYNCNGFKVIYEVRH